jgi:sodium-dependent phosphate transporter
MKKALYLALALGCIVSGVVVEGQNESAGDTAAAATTTLEVEGTDVTVVTCEPGVYDCENTKFFDYLEKDKPSDPTCAPYNNHFINPQDLKWVVGVAAVIGMVMSYGIGSNDAANSWGTSVGSGAISLRWGCFVGGIMEWAGAVAVGYGVAKTIKGTAKITTPDCFACGYCNSGMSLYAIAMLSALTAAAIFLLLASTTWMPVSTTHAIIGGAVGATWAAVGWGCLNWALNGGLGGIVLSWVASPLLSGIIGSLAYFGTNYTIIKPKLGGNPRRNAMIGIPLLYGAQAYVMMFLILMKAPLTKKKYTMNQFAIFSIPAGAGVALIGALYCWFYVRPRLPSKNLDFDDTVKKGEKQLAIKEGAADQEKGEEGNGEGSSSGSLDGVNCNVQSPSEMVDTLKTDGKEFATENIAGASLSPTGTDGDENFNAEETDAIFYFKYLLVFVAALESFAHGSNDTGNATGAVSAVIQTFQEGTNQCSKPETPVWVMAVAGFFVFLGVNTYGYRVIQTIGKSITSINFHRGWCVEFASTFTVIIATTMSMPVSTTHCQVGGVVAVGLSAFGPKKVAWSMFGRIFLTWVLTLPFAGGLAAAFTAALRPAIYDIRAA